jgi:hypothetical protein
MSSTGGAYVSHGLTLRINRFRLGRSGQFTLATGGAEGDICRPAWLRYQVIQQRYGAPVSVAFDTGQIPKADRAEAVRAAVAEHLVPQCDADPAIAILGQFIGSHSGMEGAPTALLNRSV